MKKAVTIAELLIAVLFLVVVLTGILLLFIRCLLSNESNRNLTAAVTHTEYIMEEIRATDFDTIQAGVDSGQWDLDTAAIGSAPYNLTVLDNETIDTAVEVSGELLKVTVTTQWLDRSQRSRNVSLATYIADYQ